MAKHLLDVGNCGPDHFTLTDLVKTKFDANITQTHGMNDTLQALAAGTYDLITVNRIMDQDGSSGLEIIQAIKDHETFGSIPVMLISNFESYQQQAVAAGAEPGFGKKQLAEEQTISRLGAFLR